MERGQVRGGPRRPARTTVIAAILVLAVTAFFVAVAVDVVRAARDPEGVDRATRLAAIGMGLTDRELGNLSLLISIVVFGLCALTTLLGFGILARREAMRHATLVLFTLFSLITIPLAIGGMSSNRPPLSAALGLLVGMADVSVVALLLQRKTAADIARAEADRELARTDRRSHRIAGHS